MGSLQLAPFCTGLLRHLLEARGIGIEAVQERARLLHEVFVLHPDGVFPIACLLNHGGYAVRVECVAERLGFGFVLYGGQDAHETGDCSGFDRRFNRRGSWRTSGSHEGHASGSDGGHIV